MKVFYKLADGMTVEVEVSEAVAGQLAVYKRRDENEERKIRWRLSRSRNDVSIEAIGEESDWEPTDPTANVEEQVLKREERAETLIAIAMLSEKQKQLIRLYYYEEKTLREISAVLGVHFSCVQRQIETIHSKLKNILKNF